MKVVAVLQARMSSTRLPGKVLKPLHGKPMLERQIERLRRSTWIDALVVATSDHPSDDPIVELCRSIGVDSYRGDLYDVLDRYHGAAHAFSADHVIRLTADCPLADWGVIDSVIEAHLAGSHSYTSNAGPHTYPDGLDTEAMTIEALDTAWTEADREDQREHVTTYIRERPERFDIGHVEASQDYSGMRWTVDTPEDLEFVRRVYDELFPTAAAFTWTDVLSLLERIPELSAINTPTK